METEDQRRRLFQIVSYPRPRGLPRPCRTSLIGRDIAILLFMINPNKNLQQIHGSMTHRSVRSVRRPRLVLIPLGRTLGVTNPGWAFALTCDPKGKVQTIVHGRYRGRKWIEH